jgi:hypothetical protein
MSARDELEAAAISVSNNDRSGSYQTVVPLDTAIAKAEELEQQVATFKSDLDNAWLKGSKIIAELEAQVATLTAENEQLKIKLKND